MSSVIGTLQIFTGVGMLMGPLIGSALFTLGGFELPFYVVSIILLLYLGILARLLHEESPTEELEDQHVQVKTPIGILELLSNFRVLMLCGCTALALA